MQQYSSWGMTSITSKKNSSKLTRVNIKIKIIINIILKSK